MSRVGTNRRRLGGAVVAGLLFALVVVSLLPSAGVSGTVTSTLTPTDDSYVLETSPSANFGTSTQLSASTSPITRSYLKFTVPALAGPVSRATLRVYPTRTSATGFDVRSAANNWNESQITYRNAPTPSATITGSSGALTAGTWASVDVTSLVGGAGTETFVLTSTATTADLFGSRESANQPQLVVDVNDTTLPVVTLTAPARNATLTTPLPTYSGKAGNAVGDSATVNVKVYAGSTPTGTPLQTLTATRGSNNNYSVTATSPLPNGTYTAQAEQQDAAGNTGLSGANTFTINDTTAPTVTLTQPANGANLNTATPTYAGVAGNAAGDSATVTVNVYAGSTPTGAPVQTLTSTRGANNSYSVTATVPLPNGTYTARSEQQDAAGNTGRSSANTFTVPDTTPPTVTLTQPANGAALSTAAPTYAGVAGNAAGDSATVTVKVYAGSTPTGTPLQTLTATRQGDNSYSVTATSPLPNGTYTAQSQQQDAGGNTGLSSANTFTISDTTAPSVTLTQPANGATLASATPAFAGVAGNATGDSATVTVKVYAGSTPTGSPVQTLSATRQGDNSYSVTAATLADGTYTAQATQSDTGGNTGSSAANTFTVDTTAPAVTLTQPSSGASLATATPSFSGSAGAAVGDSSLVQVNVYAGTTPTGTPVQTLNATAQSGSYLVTASSPLAEGTYTARAQQQDAAGNTGTSSANTFTIDTTAPAVTLTQPAAGATLGTATPTIAGVAGNAAGDSAAVTVKLYAGSTPTGTPVQTLSATRQGDNSYSGTASSALAEGTYTAQSTQADAAGNTGSSSASTFTIDTTAPTVTLTQPTDGATVSTGLPTFAGAAGNATGDSPTVTVKLYAGSTPTGTPLQTLSATRQGDSTYSVTATSSLTDGAYTAQTTQTDAAGNSGTSSANTFTVTLPDTAPPNVTLTQPADGATVSSATPTYAGVAGNATGDSPTVTVKVYAGPTPTGTPLQTLTATRQGDNSYSVTATSALPNGTYTAQSQQQDASGNTGLSSANTFAISDTTAPAVTLMQPADGATLSTGTLTYAGVAGSAAGDSATVTIKVYAGSTPTGTPLQTLSATRQGDNTYSVTASSSLADGTYTTRAQQQDAGGNTGLSSANTFTVDTTAPNVTLTQPADGTTLSTGTPTFTGVAGNAPGDSAGVTVKVYAGSTPTGTPLQTLSATRQGDNSYSVSAATLADGTYTAQAAQADSVGNTGASSANTFTIDTTAPAVTLTQPADGSSLSTGTPTYAGAAGSATGDSATVTVKVYAGSNPTGTPLQTLSATRQGDNSYSVTAASPLPNGTYTAQSEQQDAAGNTGHSSANTFTLNVAAPNVTLTQPADGAALTTVTPTYTGVAGSASGDSASVTVKVYAGSNPTGTPVQTLSATRQGNNSYSVTASTSLADGTYTAQATQSDSAGNAGSSSANTFTVDTTPPSVTLTQPTDGATLTTATPSFAGSAGNAAGDSSLVQLNVYAGASPTGTPVQTLSATRQPNNSYSVSASALADGTYTAQTTQADSAGNSGASSANTFTVDTTAPAVTLTQPAGGATLSNGTPTFAGVAGHATGDSATLTVKVYAGSTPTGTPLQTLSAIRQGDNSYSVTASSSLADGTYTAQATQTDSAGNTGLSSANTFTIDTTAPTVTLTQPADGASLSTGTPTYAGAAGNATGDAATVTVKVYAGSTPTGTPLQTLSATRQGNSYSVAAASSLTDGTYTAQATQTDTAGNTGTSSANTFTVTLPDTTPPNVTLTQPANGATLSTGLPTYAGVAGNAAGDSPTVNVKVYAGSNPTGTPLQTLTATRQGDNSYSVTATSSLTDGTYTAQATQSDAAGNTGTSSANTFTIALPDTTPPNVTLTQPANGAVLSSGTATFAGVAGNAAGDSATVTVKVYSGTSPTGAPLQTLTATRQGNNSYSVASSYLNPGTYTARAEQRDAAGNTGLSSANTFTVRTTVVSLTFNDGISSQYTYARPVLQGHNMNGTFYVPSGWISNLGGYMSWGQLDNLYRDGNEIGGMDTDHVNLTQVFNSDWTQDYAYKRQEVCGDHDRLAQLGYDPRSFAYPASAYNYTFPDGSTVKGIVQNCGYLTGRRVGGLSTTGTAAEPIPPTDAYALRTSGLPNSAITLASLQAAVTAAVNQGGGWVPIAFNSFCHQGDSGYSSCISSANQPIDDAVFSQFLDWLRNAGQPGGAPAGVNVQTVRQVMGAPAQPPLPARPTTVSLTFDDGHVTHYTDARSILSSHGMHGTFFINSGKIGADGTYMTWPQVNALYADGNEIGGHTSQHVNLTQVDTNEATREICYDRNVLLNHGFPVTDMAYPYGAKNASVESIAQACGYNSARGAETVAGGCPPTCADLIPPRDPYATKVVASGSDSLATLENRVTSAEQNGGGWVQIVIHEVCNGCGTNAITPATLNSFLDWLQPRAATGTTVKTVQQVIGGSVQPPVAGPSIPPAVGATNGLTNPSLEQDTNGDGIPDCFNNESWGTQTRTWTRTSDAHTGSFAERVDVSNYSSGANKLNVFQDLGYCAPTVTPGHRYVLTTWYKSTAPVDFVVEKRDSNWLYTFWQESSPMFPASSTWTQATWTTPVVPAGINGLTFGLSLAANGSMTVDDIGIVDANP